MYFFLFKNNKHQAEPLTPSINPQLYENLQTILNTFIQIHNQNIKETGR